MLFYSKNMESNSNDNIFKGHQIANGLMLYYIENKVNCSLMLSN